jgi:nucleoside-diphosphate-sugar epimerase
MSSSEGADSALRFLVTGGLGLLGAAVARRLAGAGVDVVATHRGAPVAFGGIEWFGADLTRPDALADLQPFDAVVHTAAMLPRSHQSSDAEADANRRIDEGVFTAARRWHASIVFTSSVAVYGAAVPPPDGLSEGDAPQPIGAYAAEKVWAEEHGRQLAATDGLAFTSLRVSAPYGPGQRSRTVLRAFVESASRGEALEYWGSGLRQQDFIHADDVAGACEAALSHKGGVFNVASGKAITMRELAEIVARAARLPMHAVRPSGTPDTGENRRVAYSIARSRKTLGWQPRISLPAGVSAWLSRLGETAEQ